jgi:membrane-bound serine protease (ClpP class)
MSDLAQSVWLLLTNPNISFLLLVLGLWSIVLAVSIPGTGLPEVAAIISLTLAPIGLFQLPLNLVGLALIGLALLLFILEFRVNTNGALLLGGTVALALGALAVYGGAGTSSGRLSWVTVVAAPALSTLVFGLLLRKSLAAQNAPPVHDLQRLIGSVGVTRTEVARQGSVYVGGELWSATAQQRLPAGTRVVVLERRGLVLKVAPLPVSPHDLSPPDGAEQEPEAVDADPPGLA